MADRAFSPNEFMRSRRPERFSDSLPVEHSDLEQATLEYYLDTLTSRSQELDFERFARAIAEREICPNLIPHTGPSGGGDSKADTETYPVSDMIALNWYQGIGREASAERWAFAFSAKKKWRQKAIDDATALVAAARGYKKIFFITNQFVRDKQRAVLEDELKGKLGVDVHILDRAWLVESVLKHGNQDIAIAILGAPATLRTERVQGPHDVAREMALRDSDERVTAALASGSPSINVAADALTAAIAARGLARPRAEVDGRFLRARELADKFGTPFQQLDAVYQWAWATYWWFEDFSRFTALYSDVERLALALGGTSQLESLSSLWMCLRVSTTEGHIDQTTSQLATRTAALLAGLDKARHNDGQRGSAYYADVLALQVQLVQEPANASAIFAQLGDTIRTAADLVSFPFEATAQLIVELGQSLGPLPSYESLFSTVVEMSGSRQGDLAAARLLVQRGAQLLDSGASYEAIASLGAALTRLHKEESRDDLIRALYFCGHAYALVGLPWAARGALVNAASLATADTWSHGDVSLLQLRCYRRVRWVELELGRLPQVLVWHEAVLAVRGALRGTATQDVTDDEDLAFDSALGAVLLRCDLGTLSLLRRTPAVLERLYLQRAAWALLLALGQIEHLPAEWRDAADPTHPDHSILRQWRDQGAAGVTRRPLSTGLELEVPMTAKILGCDVQMRCENGSPSLELGESVLAAIESFLSTGLKADVVALEPHLAITIQTIRGTSAPFGFRIIEDKGRPRVVIECAPFLAHSMAHDAQARTQNLLADLLIAVFARAFYAGDIEHVMTTLLRDERALERAIAFTRSFVAVGNVLGHDAKTRVDQWALQDDPEYPPLRAEPWDKADQVAEAVARQDTAAKRAAAWRPGQTEEAPQALAEGRRTARQSEITTISPIRGRLWDEAHWNGVAIGTFGAAVPPALGLLFKNGKPATEIFEAWREELGEVDRDEQLYVAIITGISTANPFAYRVLIGPNPPSQPGTADSKYLFMMYRMCTVEPKSAANLERFLSQLAATGSYFLAPAVLLPGEAMPSVGMPLAISKSLISVREAWEVGRHDLEVAGILPDDDPIIPSGRADAPVLEVLAFKRSGGHAQSDTDRR